MSSTYIKLGNGDKRVRVNENIKTEATTVLATMGLTLDDAYRMLLIHIVNERGLPFDSLIPNNKTIAAMKAAREGKLTTINLNCLISSLNADN
jgi:DNA-damage-inducible protein J